MNTKIKLTAQEIESELAQYYGTENYYKHYIPSMVYTDGIQAMAKMCEAYWLIDVVASYQTIKFQTANSFQVWKITKKPTRTYPEKYVVECSDGNGNVLQKQTIKFSDFPLEEIKMYVVDGVMMLPSEY